MSTSSNIIIQNNGEMGSVNFFLHVFIFSVFVNETNLLNLACSGMEITSCIYYKYGRFMATLLKTKKNGICSGISYNIHCNFNKITSCT